MFDLRIGAGGHSTTAIGAPASRGGPFESTQALFIRLTNALAAWHERAEARRRLATFDDRMLRDIGIDRATAETESAKPFWRA